MTELIEIHYVLFLVGLALSVVTYHIWRWSRRLAVRVETSRNRRLRYNRTKFFFKWSKLPPDWIWWEDFKSDEE